MPNKVLGTAVKRNEDVEFLRGEAKFTADITLPGMLYMAILRSRFAHAMIKNINTREAEKMPGVVRVLTGAEIKDKIMPLPCVWIPGGAESHFPSHPMGMPGAGYALAVDKVRYVGDPVAVVVAETEYQAQDALKAIHVDYQPLPVVIDAEEAIQDGAPQLHSEVPNKRLFRVLILSSPIGFASPVRSTARLNPGQPLANTIVLPVISPCGLRLNPHIIIACCWLLLSSGSPITRFA
jgi:carbon-monoxide dehydrogenase large subunit